MSKRLMYGQTYSKLRAFVFRFDWLKRIGVLVFGKGLFGNMGSVEVLGSDHNSLHMVRGVFCWEYFFFLLE